MSKKYIIDEELLLSLLEESLMLEALEALENGGVDDWNYYSNSIKNFLENTSNKSYHSIYDAIPDTLDDLLLSDSLEEVKENE